MDYRKVCWVCKAVSMEPKGPFYQCQGCGATWNELPKLGGYDELVEGETVGGVPARGIAHRRSGKVKGGNPLKPLRGMAWRGR